VKLAYVAALAFSVVCVGAEQEAAHKHTNVLFSQPIKDVPGKQMVVVSLEFKPKGSQPAYLHRHPGSVYVYVTQGTARLGVEGQPVQEVHAGQSFFEAPGVLHTVAESASATESAQAIAVMIVPDGAPLSIAEPAK
jgi:quercetin dioxygenase-like cupin family protein